MKNYLLLLLLISSLFYSQENTMPEKKQELQANLFDLVVAGSLNIGYEKFLKNNKSVTLNLTLFDNYFYYDIGYIEDNNVISLEAAFNLYFSKNKKYAGFFFYPLAKYRTGTQKITDYYYYNYDTNITTSQTQEVDLSGLLLGFGLGHKWVFNNTFTLGINADVARNLRSDEFKDEYGDSYYPIVELKFNVGLGYRF